jgi:hypothetical protein
MKTDYQGIDYGHGIANISSDGVRFGVINQNEVGQAWFDESEPFYGAPHCPYCGSEMIEMEQWDDECCDCHNCNETVNMDEAFGEPISYFFSDNKYKAECSEDGDIFITKSPFITYAQFCSPCAPGAVYLMSPLKEQNEINKGYCFGHDWFESGKAPYPVYDIKTGLKV